MAKVEFPDTSPMAPGSAHWLIVKNGGTFIDSGPGATVATFERFPIPVSAGWNLVGNPFNFVTVAEDTLSDGNPLQLYAYENGSWSDQLDPGSTELHPFAGYAVFSISSSTLYVKSNPVDTENNLNKRVADVLWSIRILAQCQEARDDNNVLAVTADAAREWDGLDYPEPPVVGEYVSVYFPHPDWNRPSHRFSTDIRPQLSEGQEWEFEITTNIRDVVNLTFEGLETVPAEYDIRLVDKKLNITLDLRQRNHYSVAARSADHPERLTLVVGKREYLDETLAEFHFVPLKFELLQNFPNPFNPVTIIKYQIPEVSFVTLKVYDVLGNEIATLVNEEKPAGEYEVEFSVGQNSILSPSSGIYFYQLRAGSFIHTKKMILLK